MPYGPHIDGLFAQSAYRGLIPMSAILDVDSIETLADDWQGPTHQALIPAALLLALYQHDPQLIADWFEFTRDNDGDITSSPR